LEKQKFINLEGAWLGSRVFDGSCRVGIDRAKIDGEEGVGAYCGYSSNRHDSYWKAPSSLLRLNELDLISLSGTGHL
jgi:hypothetical protein